MMNKYPEKASPHIPRSPDSCRLTQLARRAANPGPVLGSTPNVLFGYHPQHFHPCPQPLSHSLSISNPCPFLLPNMHESVLREMEKQHIREEIIISGIVRRRVLEDEVRRELAMEREMALQRGKNNGVPLASVPSPAIGFESPQRLLSLATGGGWRTSLDERIILLIDEMEKRLGGSSRESGTSPFPRISEVKSVPEGSKEKGKIISLANTNDENKTGLKRKTPTPPVELDNDVSLSDVGKKVKKWFCDVCHISATSEQALSEHMEGKKHKSAEQGAGKNYRIGMFQRKPPDPRDKLMGPKTTGVLFLE